MGQEKIRLNGVINHQHSRYGGQSLVLTQHASEGHCTLRAYFVIIQTTRDQEARQTGRKTEEEKRRGEIIIREEIKSRGGKDLAELDRRRYKV